MRQALEERWASMSWRERTFVLAGLATVAVCLVWVVMIDPLIQELENLDRAIVRNQRILRDVDILGTEYVAVRGQLTQVEAKAVTGTVKFALLPYLEEVAGQTQVRDRVTSMEPHQLPPALGYRETAAEVRLEGVHMQQVLGFLSRLEQGPNMVRVKRLQLKPRFDTPHLMEATLRVSTYEREN